jgi:hypothetical protein
MQSTAIQNPSLTQNLPTTVTTILATPASPSAYIAHAITFCNKLSTAVTVTCSIYNGTIDVYIVFAQTIAGNDTMALGGDFFKEAITNGFSIRALCNTVSAVDVVVSYTQFT